ncbi:MAG: glycosyltransferase family 2 protein [Lachnospiraceae bacterium]|nr:glycosyltransferase family 2 protein [Lachnospiraceae bacterium]
MDRKTIELVVPSYNEESCVGLFYDAVNKLFNEQLKAYDFRIIYVDDGSSDSTLEKVKKIAADAPEGQVHYISFSRNLGKEAAIYAGLEHSAGDFVAVMDADLQHPPALLIDMLHAIEEEGYDSCGARREDRKGEGAIKRIFSVAYYHIVNRMTVVELTPGSTDFRLMSRRMVDEVLKLTERERFTKGIFAWVGFKTKWIPYHNVERAAGKSKWSIRGLLHYAASGLLSFARAPLRFAIYLGAVGLLAAFIDLILLIAGGCSAGAFPEAIQVVIFLLLLFGGLTVMLLGLVGEYLARILAEAKQRPLYIIRESNYGKSDRKAG